MSAILKLHNNTLDDVIVYYNFSQVSDAVLLRVSAKNLKGQKDIVIRKTTTGWNTEVLKNVLDESMYESVCNKLNNILSEAT